MTEPNCESLYYTISIVDDSGTEVYNKKIDSHDIYNIYNLEPFTEHTVTITALNNGNLFRKTVKNIVTAETCKYNRLLKY